MDLLESILKLTDSDRQKLTETLLQLKNNGGNAGSKQKTLDSWIVKNSAPSVSSRNKVLNFKETTALAETGQSSRSTDHKDVSSVVQNTLVPTTSFEKPSTPEKERSEKQLRVLLNREDCLNSKNSPERYKSSIEEKSIDPKGPKSPYKKQEHVCLKKVLSPEKHVPTPPRSYNLRSARGVSDEKLGTETVQLVSSLLEHEETDSIQKSVHKLVNKQKPKSKIRLEIDASSNSCASIEENYDKNTDAISESISKENSKDSKCRLSATVQTEIDETSKVSSVDNDKLTISDENGILTELDTTQVVKKKRKRPAKSKESKLLSTASKVLKSSSNEENKNIEEISMDIHNHQSVSLKKALKSNFLNTNQSESAVGKTVHFEESVLVTPLSPKQQSLNDVAEPAPKLKGRKTAKIKDKKDIVLPLKIKLGSRVKTKIKKKNVSVLAINSNTSKVVDLEREISDQQLELAKSSNSESNEHARETGGLLTGDANSMTVKLDPKITHKRTGNKKCKSEPKFILSPDSELISTNNLEPNMSIEKSISSPSQNKEFSNNNLEPNMSIEKLKSSPSQNKEFTKETEELVIKYRKPLNSKRISRKRGSENKIMAETKKNILLDPDVTLTNKSKDSIISTKITAIKSFNDTPSQSKECVEELLRKDTNIETLVNLGTNKRSRKRSSENKSKIKTKKSLILDSKQNSTDNHEDSIISMKMSSKDTPSAITKDSPIKETSLVNSSSAAEKPTDCLKQNECPQKLITEECDISRNESNSSKEMKQPPENTSKKSSIISPQTLKRGRNIAFNREESSTLSSVPPKGKSLKRKSSVLPLSKKKLKVTGDEKLSNSSECISDNLGAEGENSAVNLKKHISKKKATSSRVSTDSNKQKLDILIGKSKADTSNSNLAQETDQLLEKLKVDKMVIQGENKIPKAKNSKKTRGNSKKENILKSESVSNINSSKNDEIEKMNSYLGDECSSKNKPFKSLNKNTSIKSTKKGKKSTRKTVLGNSSKKLSNSSKEQENLAEESSNIQMELISSNLSLEKPSDMQMKFDSSTETDKTCDSNLNSKDTVEKVQETVPIKPINTLSVNTSFSGKEICTKSIQADSEKPDDLLINKSSCLDDARTNFKSSVEVDKKMQHNYEAYCMLKEMLEVCGISIEKIFENQEMIHSLKSALRDGVYIIRKCKSDPNISIHLHSSKKELANTINKLKKKYAEEKK